MSLSKRFDALLHPERYEKQQPHVSRITKTERTDQKQEPNEPAYYEGWEGVPRTVMDGGDYFDYVQARAFGLSPTPLRCATRIIDDILGTQCEVVALPKDNDREPTDEAKLHAKQISNWMFNQPNENGESIYQIIGKSLFDSVFLDAGVIAKEYAYLPDHPLTQIHALDGGRFWMERNKYRRLGVVQNVTIDNKLYNNYKVGYWEHPLGGDALPWEPHEIVYMMQYPRSDIPYGTSLMYSLRNVVQAAMYGDEYYRELGENGYVGSITISAPETLTQTNYDAFKARIKEAIRGGKMLKTVPIDSNGAPKPMGFSPRDLALLETLAEYRNMIIVGFGLTPVDLGYSVSQRGSSPSTIEASRSTYIRHGLFPRLKMLEWYINSQIIWDWFKAEEPDINEPGAFMHGHVGKFAKHIGEGIVTNAPIDVAFRFKLYDPVSDRQSLEINELELKLGLREYNEILKSRGLPDVPWSKYSPLFLTDPLKFAQGFSYPILMRKAFADITGVSVEDIPAPPTPAPETTPQQDDEAFKQSRVEQTSAKPVEKKE